MMNYVGSISILDRGDAPAQAIIDKNARSLAQRVADETRDELEKVMTRVDNIYESYETSTQALMETQSTLEYVEDIAELEALIKDQIKKKKYQQQVTIFIVGYENVCGQKLRLLQQVNEFFMDNSKSYEEEDWYPKTPDIDLDDCSSKIEESLSTAKELTEKISTINADMVEWLTTYAINKASTKTLNMVDNKSKKKLESALSKAKDDVKAITEQLKSALLANEEKDDLIQTYLKQLEGKTLEAQKFKAAAEVAKKNVQGLEAKELVYQDEIEKRTSAMKKLQEDLRKIEMDASQSRFLSELNSNRLKNKDSETSEFEALQEVKIDELHTVIERHRLELQESKRELQVLHEDQIKALHDTHTADLESVRLEYADMIKKLQDDLREAELKVDDTEKLVADAADAADQARQELLALQLEGSTGESRPATEIESQPPDAEDDGISRDSSRQKKKLRFDRSKSRSRSRESRPSTKDTRSSKGAPAKVTVTRTTPAAKVVTKPVKPESKSPVKAVKETADASIQDEGGDPTSAHVETRQSKRARSTLETVKESDLSADFDDAFDLADENSWALVPMETVPGRFAQYRKMTVRKLSELEEQLGLTVAKTQRKVTTLKSQFQEHKSKWETERKVLIEQVEQAQKLQTEAEKEADVAMTQLEEFINEQERLEEEEEVKRQEVVKGVSKPVMVSIPTQHEDDESEVVTSSSPKTLTPVQPGAETGAPPPTFVQSEESEHELTNLMQQTDDAKAQEINARKSSGALSAPPAVEPEAEPRDKIKEAAEDIITDSDPAIVSHQPQTVEHSEQSENIESFDRAGVIDVSDKSENDEKFEIIENGDSSCNFEQVENSQKNSVAEDCNKPSNLEISESSENFEQSKLPSEMISGETSLENEQNSETQTIFDPEKQGDLQTPEVLKNSPIEKQSENSELTDMSFVFKEQDNISTDQSKMCSDDASQSQKSNDAQQDNLVKSMSPNQSEQPTNDRTTYQNEVDSDQSQAEKISQSDLKVPLSVSDCSAKVESKGSSATSRSEVIDSKFIKKVDITYPKDEHADDIDVKDNWDSYHGDGVEVNDDESSVQNIDTLSGHENENIESEASRLDTIRIGSKLQLYGSDFKNQRKVIRSEVKIPEVMTQHFDPSLYDREKLKVTGLPLMQDNFTEPSNNVLPSSRKPSKVKRSQKSNSDLSLTRRNVISPGLFPVGKGPVHVVMENAFPSQTNADIGKLNQAIYSDSRDHKMVEKPFSKTDQVENVRPVQRFRETIDEDSILTIHTGMQGTMGNFVTTPETQTQIVPKTEEEIRACSALSRASLRKEYRNKLGEVRAAVEDRRTKSPAISIPSQRSLEDDQLIDEDDDDDIPYNEIDDMKREQTMEMGTSPPPGQRGQSSSKLSQVGADHPVVSEYLRLYEGVVQFRNALSKLMVDRDMLQPSGILEDIDTKTFNSTGKVEPQIEGMTHNVYHVFEEILSVLSSILQADREPMVSSLTGGGMIMSRDTTQAVVGPKSAESGRGPTVTRASHHSQFSAKSDVSDRIALRELQEQYDRLQHQLTSDTRKHEEQIRHNTVVMMEMQDTINELQRELSNLGRSSSRLRPQSDTTSPHGTTDSAIMFTRLDSERNSKIMKRAVNDQKMNADKYKDALDKMEDYVGLPAQRFAHLVRKYVHHSRMKEIEENVKKSKSLNENVFEILDKMEALQNERAKTWADKMDQMGSERLRLANLLMETLDSIEQESGIFLIKPMYSYRGRDIKDARYGGKLTRPIRPQRNLSPHRENQSSFAPAPTPASNMRLIRGQPVPTTQSMTHETTVPKHEVPRSLEGDEGGISGASLNWVGTSQKQTWSMNSSVVRGDPENFLSSQNPNAMNTPRILELDINRMLIGQNTISSKITQPGMTEDRLVNASQNNLRSYITVNRPTAVPGNARPRSFASSATKEFVPPSSPVSQNTKRVRMSEGDMSRTDMSRNMTNTPPLPPIGSASSREIPGEPPRSPPGSSMRLSPPHVQEVISPLK
ncbi:myosin-6-like isoform X4 [Pecten maximus]|uniref:myosin-6-like isoform X4 n=1 Tax=Pecten maximus TaxID=6579 RepID=UPI001457F60E|nr:myosin-6-like isoform X4 [Pecten maximus]